MNNLTRVLAVALAVAFAVVSPETAAGDEKEEKKAAKAAEERVKIDEISEETLAKLLADPDAKKLYDESYGYAVFDSRKVALLLKSGGGAGVAVDGDSGKRTYMRMASLGVGIGFGIEFFQAVFLFEDKARFDDFVENGWVVEGSASAAAGEDNANAHAMATDVDTAATGSGGASAFSEGIAVFRFSEKGLIASADVSGTKYWKDGDLNN